jgi:hypothetical protein
MASGIEPHLNVAGRVELETDILQPQREPAKGVSVAHLAGIGMVAAVLRTCNLGAFSMWLDEILITLRAQGSLSETWLACRANAEHPPLPALVMSVGNTLGFNEHVQRLIPVALGITTVVLVAAWVSAVFGRRDGVIAGLLCAISPFHIRYSQDLKGYSYLAFFVILTYVAVLLVEKRAGWKSSILLTIATCGGLYSSISYMVIAVPLIIYCIERNLASRSKTKRSTRWFAISFGAALVGYVPWLPTLFHAGGMGPRGGVKPLTWSLVLDRWQFLTVAGREIDQLGWGGALAMAIFVVGVFFVARRVYGRLVLVSFLTGTLGVEVLLRVKGHWSDGRYNTVGWLFLIVLVAVGIDRLMTLGRKPALGVCLLAAVFSAHIEGVIDLQRKGRPSWDRMAEVVRQVRRSGERVYTSNGHAQVSISYYLQGADFRKKRNEPKAPIPLAGDLNRLFELWTDDQSCLLVLGQPFTPEILRAARHFPEIVRYYSTGRLYRLTPEIRSVLQERGQYPSDVLTDSSVKGWPEPAMDLVPVRLKRTHHTCLGALQACIWGKRPWYSETRRIELDESTSTGLLVQGWSAFERDSKGRTFSWITGREASALLIVEKPGRYLLSLRLWPLTVSGRKQKVRGLLNGVALGELTLGREPQTVTVNIPPELIRIGENLLTLQFAYAVTPRRSSGAHAQRDRFAAAVDWIEIAEIE